METVVTPTTTTENEFILGGEKLISFTEPELDIIKLDGEHSALINGVKARGGSSFKYNFTKPFSEWAAVNSAKAWNESVDDVKLLWKDKGSSTATFGTGIHKVLEYENNNLVWDVSFVEEPMQYTRKLYMKHLALGERIAKIKKGATENYAKPTHMDIRALMKATKEQIHSYTQKIVSEFKELYKSLGYNKYDSLAEVYVTYSPYAMGGEIDKLIIIDKEKKICRVADYKIKDKVLDELSSNNELINELAKSKASENDVIRIQLSFYAFCLWKAGWTVQGGDVFGRNGKWTHYKINLIPMEEMEKLLVKYL